MERRNKDFNIKISFIEIYNEILKDLLVSGVNEENGNLEIREDPQKGVYVQGVQEVVCASTDDVLNLLHQGNYNRTTESTDANEQSS